MQFSAKAKDFKAKIVNNYFVRNDLMDIDISLLCSTN